MPFRKAVSAFLIALSSVALASCATGLNTQVSRYQAAQIPAGQSFYVVPKEGAPDNRFYRYAEMISEQMRAQGYRAAGAPQLADMLVRVDFGVDEGRVERAASSAYGPGYDPFYDSRFGGGYGYWRNPYYDPFWGVYYGRPYYSRWSRFPYYYGWNDPFWYGGAGGYGPYGGVREYTVYKSHFDMDIVRRADNAPLFEGHAKARSQTDELDALVPNLISAMFTGFPGRNGETVRITVPNERN